MSTLLQKVQSGELNPIIYMPMSSAADCHVNYGYGGDFVQNGVLDTASRGPNQWNCVASEFDGVDDYLNNNGITGLSDSSLLTCSFTIKPTTEKMYIFCML